MKNKNTFNREIQFEQVEKLLKRDGHLVVCASGVGKSKDLSYRAEVDRIKSLMKNDMRKNEEGINNGIKK